MPTPIIEINDFSSGITDDPTTPATNAFQALVGVDFTSKEGELRLAKAVNDENVTGTLTQISAFETYGGKPYAIGGDKVWVLSGGWSVAHTDSGASSSDKTQIIAFNGILYHIHGTRIGEFNGSTWTDDDNSLGLNVSSNPIVFGGKLYIPNQNKVATIDESGNYDANALSLPSEITITCAEVIGDRIALGTAILNSSGNVENNQAKVYFWDGGDTVPTKIVDAEAEGCWGLKNMDNELYLLAGKHGKLYRYNGADFDVIRRIPDGDAEEVVFYSNAMEVIDGDLLFGASVSVQTGAADLIMPGVWRWGRFKRGSARRQLSLSYRLFKTTQQTDRITIRALKFMRYGQAKNQKALFIAGTYWTGSQEDPLINRVDEDSNKLAKNAFCVTQRYEIAKDEERLVKGLQLLNLSDDFPEITVKYRVDSDTATALDSNWTTLGTISKNDNYNKILYGIYKRCRVFQARWDLSDDSLQSKNHKITKFSIY